VATLIATPGAADANSYLTLARAAEILSMHYYGSSWTSLSDEQQETALMMGTMFFDSEFEWLGTASFPGQALAFPRLGLLRRNGQVVDGAAIPSEVEFALANFALLLTQRNLAAINTVAARGITELQAGPVKLKFQEGFEATVVPAIVTRFIPKSWYVNDVTEELGSLIESV
jgi:hypothetical protein